MAKFELGSIVATESIIERMKTDHPFNHFINACLKRFQNCDWGDICEEDRPLMDAAVECGNEMILGSYKFTDGQKVWIITDADHHATTICYPHER